MATAASQNLEEIRDRVRHILAVEIPRFASEAHHPPPILDTSALEGAKDSLTSRRSWEVPGLKKLETDMGRELSRLEKFLSNPSWRDMSPLSTNATYMLAVWDEVIASRAVLGVCKTFNVPAAVKRKAKSVGPSDDTRQELGVKVDVISEDGKKWTRINTLTNSRFLRELYELDGSESSEEEDVEAGNQFGVPIATQPTHNTLITMGKLLLDAAKLHPVPEDAEKLPHVCIRLTRIGVGDSPTSQTENDGLDRSIDIKGDHVRVQKQVDRLRALGIEVQIGERLPPSIRNPPTLSEDPISRSINSQEPYVPKLIPTLKLNLDLSILIALTSDITHALLPVDSTAALERFRSPIRYRPDKKGKYMKTTLAQIHSKEDDKDEIGKHARSLANQTIQEMTAGGLINSLRTHLHAAASNPPMQSQDVASSPPIELWTTPSAKDRCFRIIAKIGGEAERKRAYAMFEQNSDAFWENSRYGKGSLPGLPVRLLPSDVPLFKGVGEDEDEDEGGFWTRLRKTCHAMLSTPAGTRPPKPIPDTPEPDGPNEMEEDSDPESELDDTETPTNSNHDSNGAESQEQDLVPDATPTVHRMTTHTAQSLLWGAYGHMTTLTANKASVKSVLKEMRTLFGSVDGGVGRMREGQVAAIWVVEPRSLAEGMRSDLGDQTDNATC